MYKGYSFSRTTYYRRKKKAEALGCDIMDVPDGRGKHGNQVRGQRHYRWNKDRIITCTAHFGYWPEGAVFTIHSHGKDQERLVQIQDGRVVDVDSNEVMHTRYGVQWCWEQGE